MLMIEKTHTTCPQEIHDTCACVLPEEVVINVTVVEPFALESINVSFEVQP